MFGSLRYRLIVPLALLLALTTSSLVVWSADQKVRPVREITVVDARGRIVGALYEPTIPTVVVRVGELPVALQASRHFLGPIGHTFGSDLSFESADCTGQTFGQNVFGSASPNDLFPIVAMNNTSLFRASGETRTVIVRSFIGFSDTPPPCVEVEPTPADLMPYALLADLASEFQPPFSLRFGD
jgi:hypothetical protein